MEQINLTRGPRLDELLSTLPACRRCRANRRRCDTLLPSCRNCAKSGAECVFFDHVLDEDLPRSYISSLVEALDQTSSPNQSQAAGQQANGPESDGGPSAPGSARQTSLPREDSRYIGQRSALSQSLAIRGPESFSIPPDESTYPLEELGEDLIVKPRMHQFLLQKYLSVIHPIYPFLDSSLPFLSPHTTPTQDLSPAETFILQMVYSITCQCIQGRGNQLLPLSDACYTRALQHIDSATANLTIITLQAITLLAMHSLFDPQKGNFGQLITLAARLAIDIGGQDMPARGENMRNIHSSIYCMENQVTVALDRPPFLPEPKRAIEFDVSQPSEFLCSLYRVQSKFRKGAVSEARKLLQVLNIEELERQANSDHPISPNIMSAVYETQLLMDPNTTSAIRLLNTYAHPNHVEIFLTPQWVYRAGLILLEHQDTEKERRSTVMEGYGTSLILLDRAALRWKGAAAMSESLRSYMKRSEGR